MELDYKQKRYNVMFAVTQDVSGRPLHTIPLQRITRDELKYLAFTHGATSIVAGGITFVGEEVVMYSGRGDDGKEVFIPVRSQMEEYMRIARKYDMTSELIGVGKSRDRVEACFKVRLDDFDDSVLTAVDPLVTAENMAAQAELTALAQLEAETRPDAQKKAA